MGITFTTVGRSEIFQATSDQSVLVPWPARSLRSREVATVRIRVYGKSQTDSSYDSKSPSPWSPASTVEAALLDPADLRAHFIASATRIGQNGPLQPICFRKDFTLPADIVSGFSARLYITALGVFEAWINRQRVTDECMAPGWQSYKHGLVYRILDVTSLLRPGQKNTIAAEVGEGWYAGRLGFNGGIRFRYGEEIGLFAQLEVAGASLTAAKALDRLVRTARFHISTGFAGTPVITHALTTVRRPRLAYRVLLETTCPSWLYPVVAMGAATIWERWDSMMPDGRINPGTMTSFNHYALGAVAD